MAKFTDWNFFNKNVQSGLTEGQFINMAGCLICAGPPFLSVTIGSNESQLTGASDVVYPVGLISQWQIGQNVAVVPVPEAGSYRRYTITGPADGSFSFGRSLYHGPSLLRTLYAYYQTNPNFSAGYTQINALTDGEANLTRNPKERIYDVPGHENLWLNMASDLFSQPVGILLYIQDVNRESYGAVYLEQIHIAQHGISSGPGQLVVSENASCMFARCRPVKLANPIPLMSTFEDSGVITTSGTMTEGGQKKLTDHLTQSNQ